jgi:tRNA threonylcarbamoyl adenosine modification protein YeaZ
MISPGFSITERINMKILAWDTSQGSGVGVAIELTPMGRSIAAQWDETPVAAGARADGLLSDIDGALSRSGWKLEDVGAFAVGTGPGSFTGLRIGLVTARTLALALGKPLIPVPSLEILHYPLRSPDPSTASVVAVTACRGEIYCLYFDKGTRHQAVLAPESLGQLLSVQLEANPGLSWSMLGNARREYAELWLKTLPADREKPLEPSLNSVSPTNLGALAIEIHRTGRAFDPNQVRPEYLRAPDAELKMNAGSLKRHPVAE